MFFSYFGAVGFGWAQPVYAWVAYRFDAAVGDVWDVVLIVLVLHVGPTTALWLGRLAAGRKGRVLDAVVYSAALLSVLRQLQLTHFAMTSRLAVTAQYAIVFAGAAVAILTIRVLRRHLSSFVFYLGILSLAFPGHFAWAYVRNAPVEAARLAPASGSRGASRPDRAVFIFVVDELSTNILLNDASDIDGEAFPHLHRFSREAVWFRQAIANYYSTAYSFLSMFTGTFVHRLEKRSAPDFTSVGPQNLLSALEGAGYRVHFYSRFLKCSSRVVRCLGYGRRLEMVSNVSAFVLSQHVPSVVSARLLPWLPARVLRFEGDLLGRLGGGELSRPGEASILHLMVSHVPYVLSADGVPVASGDFRPWPGADAERVLARYRAQVRYLDRQFGAFLDGLKAAGADRRSVIVLTSDHGTCWKPGCMGRLHVTAIEPSLARVPMMVRAPSLTAGLVEADYQHIDFYSTLLGLIREPPALPLPARERPRWFFVNEHEAVRLGLPAKRIEVTGHLERLDGSP